MTSVHKYFYQDFGFEYKWTLRNFSSCDKPIGKSIKTDVFVSYDRKTKSESKWRLKLYPKGNSTFESDYVSIFLQSMNNFHIKIDCKLTLSISTKVIYNELKFSHVFRELDSTFGFRKCIKREPLLNDLKKGDDVLTIHCELDFDKSQPKFPQINISKDIGSLLEMKKHCDVNLTSSDGRKHKAHKAILSCRSKVFAAMFEHDMKESQENVVKIDDMDNEILTEMLHFIYTGEVKNVQNDKAKKLFIVADKYELNDLKEMCMYYLNENVNNDNVLELLDFASTYNVLSLRQKAERYFLDNSVAVMAICNRDEKMKHLSRQTIEYLLHASVMKQIP